MSNIPLEVIDSILEYNNTKLVCNKKTKSFHLRFLDFNDYKKVSDVYVDVIKRGTSNRVKNQKVDKNNTWNYTVWHEFSNPGKWFIREYTLIYTDTNKVDDFLYIMYANHKAYYTMKITYNEDQTVCKRETIKHT
uniref:Uncharacterized protein n=1 Tax=viral metagenome TaxID=1070528 RepID=A0A6C0I5S9_9ZZZZ